MLVFLCRSLFVGLLCFFAIFGGTPSYAEASRVASPSASSSAALMLEHLRADPVRLELFLRALPKGADLHNHLSGAIYAESFLKWAAQDGLCVSLAQKTILPRPCRAADAAQEAKAEALPERSEAWNAMVNALSMRNFVPTELDRSGHDHFFATFMRFIAATHAHEGDMLAEAAERAAHDHVHYVEFQIAPIEFSILGEMMKTASLPPLHSAADLPKAYAALQPVLGRMDALVRTALDNMEARARAVMQCGTSHAAAGCDVVVRYQYSALRVAPPPFVWIQLVAAYEAVHHDGRMVGVNIVAPEDDPVALRDYDLHMQMFHYLNHLYPETNLSLHAGEITPSLVPLGDLDHHIRAAIDVAGAKRIGHGVDVMWERDPASLLHDMAQHSVLVEINLTSNDEILGVSGARHPFALYRRAGVPVALSTDDEGVSRGDLTQEYMRAVTTYHLTYAELLHLSRTGLEYGFMPGQSLWVGHHIGQIVPICAGAERGNTTSIASACKGFLHENMKAREQWRLEGSLHRFEQDIVHDPLLAAP